LIGHRSHTTVPVGRLAHSRPHEEGAGTREAAQLGAAALEVVAFGGAAPTGGGAKKGIKALTESKIKELI
jgi:hypothetical protein